MSCIQERWRSSAHLGAVESALERRTSCVEYFEAKRETLIPTSIGITRSDRLIEYLDIQGNFNIVA
jgi:hypothetical protein